MTLHWAKTIHHGVWMGGMTISSDSRLLLMHFSQSLGHLQVWRIWDALHLKTFYYQNSWDNYVDGNIMLLGTDTTLSPKLYHLVMGTRIGYNAGGVIGVTWAGW